MRAVAVTPGVARSARLIERELPAPGRGEVRVRVLSVGVCGTDLEIDAGRYGEAPPGEDVLFIGHESLGEVEEPGPASGDLPPGTLVVAMVRRPDGCEACARGEPDMCVGGQFTERGIKGRHGFMAERYVEAPEWLVPIPPQLRPAGVLLEPLSAVEKGIRQAYAIQARLRAWTPRRALVIGAGPVGVLAAMVFRLRQLETFVYARKRSAERSRHLAAIGAHYVAQRAADGAVMHLADLPRDLGPFDVVLEATGSADAAVTAMLLPGPDGVVCLVSVTGGEEALQICASCLNQALVMGNRTVVGSVNANRVDFEQGVRDLDAAEERWPGWAASLITRRVTIERFREALERRPGDVKAVIEP